MNGRIHPITKTVILLTLLLTTCQSDTPTLTLATTTTTVDSGFMAAILPAFEQKYNAVVDVVAVGTGEALALGEAGDVDVILVHARSLEDTFVAAGYGINRRDVMVNDFVLLGPAADPAGIAGMRDAVAAMAQIAAIQSPFISRGDQSGTHLREQELWANAGIMPQGEWYLSVGQDMGATLTIAGEQQAYTLSDRATFIARQSQGFELIVLAEGDARLLNPYGVIAINPALQPQVEAELAQLFINWITSAETQSAINHYRINEQQLFLGNAQN